MSSFSPRFLGALAFTGWPHSPLRVARSRRRPPRRGVAPRSSRIRGPEAGCSAGQSREKQRYQTGRAGRGGEAPNGFVASARL